MSKVESAWFLYLIRTAKGSVYTGITTDVERRYAEHQAGGMKAAKSLKGKGPLLLQFHTRVGSHSSALKLEYKVKRLSKAKKEGIILGTLHLMELYPELMLEQNNAKTSRKDVGILS